MAAIVDDVAVMSAFADPSERADLSNVVDAVTVDTKSGETPYCSAYRHLVPLKVALPFVPMLVTLTRHRFDQL